MKWLATYAIFNLSLHIEGETSYIKRFSHGIVKYILECDGFVAQSYD